ncbi:helix-turn-helix domain-containing protein [Nocardia sp. NPDC059195]|uniref:helix-turn-helix domain-containing protein n=1 Tax=Nocardia sp. NPDC059195 TaxID=3346765 RepID=UPI00368016A8
MLPPEFPACSEYELLALLRNDDRAISRQLAEAACRGMNPDAFHPDADDCPDSAVLERCDGCSARLACLAVALRAEDPDTREGWYGGLGPVEREAVAKRLSADAPTESRVSDRAAHAARLRAAGYTVAEIASRLGCSDRTVQRDLRTADTNSGPTAGELRVSSTLPESAGTAA